MFSNLKKCLLLVDRSTVMQGAGIGVLILLGVSLEAIGIGLLFPFIKFVSDPASINQYEMLTRFIGPITEEMEVRFLVIMALGLVGLFLIKNLFLLLINYVQARFMAKNESLLAQRMFAAYMNGAYSLHLLRNTADFLRTISASVSSVFSGFFMSHVILVTECIMVAALISILFAVDPLMTVSAVASLGAGVGFYYLLVRRPMAQLGKREQTLKSSLFKSMQQGLHNIKEVKILGREQFILKEFSTERDNLARVKWLIRAIQSSPRLWVETIMVTFTLLMVVVFLMRGGDSGQIFAALAVFAAVGVRLIPSLNRILTSSTTIRTASPAIEIVYDDLTTFDGTPDPAAGSEGRKLSFTKNLALEDVSFTYDNAPIPAINGIFLEIEYGESIGLVGPSGAGKTTLVDLILGILTPTDGKILIDGRNIEEAMAWWRRQVGYVPQNIYLIDDTLRRNIAFGLADDEIDEDAVNRAIERAQLGNFVESLPDGLDTILGERGVRFSGGQAQRVGIARALYRDPPVLILDEATSSLDSKVEHEITGAIESLMGEKTLIIIAHRLSTVRKCNRLVFVTNGQISDTGSFEDLNTKNTEFRKIVELSQL